MRLAGWKSRAMLQRYGALVAAAGGARTRAMSYADRHGQIVEAGVRQTFSVAVTSRVCRGYCLVIAMRVRCSGSRRWSWPSRPASSRTQLIVPLNLLSGAR